jgi:hypothetical protein
MYTYIYVPEDGLERSSEAVFRGEFFIFHVYINVYTCLNKFIYTYTYIYVDIHIYYVPEDGLESSSEAVFRGEFFIFLAEFRGFLGEFLGDGVLLYILYKYIDIYLFIYTYICNIITLHMYM